MGIIKDLVEEMKLDPWHVKLRRWWRLKKWSCKHSWKIHNTTNQYDTEIPDMPTKVRQTLICQECGQIKQINL